MVPLVLLTGFLGAGKTTLLNAWLDRADDTHRIAVIENELGPVAVDEQLVANRHDQMPTMTIVSGCVCCSGAVDLVAALEAIGEWADDRLKAAVIETTGMADVAPVLELLRDQEDPLFSMFGPVVCVCVVAADQEPQPGSIPALTYAKQLAFADRVQLTKLDVASAAAEEPRVRARIAEMNPLADVFTTMELEQAVRAVEHHLPQRPLPLRATEAAAANGHDLSLVTTFIVAGSVEASYDIERLREQLMCMALWRVKGVVHGQTDGVRFLCQGVGSTVALTSTELAVTGLIVIHQADLIPADFAQVLASCHLLTPPL